MPEFSPAMLRLFLHARCRHAEFEQPARCGYAATRKRVLGDLRRRAGVTHGQIDMAWMGRLRTARPRQKLWRALGLDPADHGVVLTNGGQAHG